MTSWEEAAPAVRYAAASLTERLGAPDLGVVLGSGWHGLAAALPAGAIVPLGELPGFPSGVAGGVGAARLSARTAWVFTGRLHLYEGRSVAEVAHAVRVIAAAGATGVVLTFAAGGLRDDDVPGRFALVRDHLNLTGSDPLRAVPSGRRGPAFLDLQGVYDPDWSGAWRSEAARAGVDVRDGIVAAVPGPCYETPAEVRMLRALGADLASMSTVPEAIVARYLGLRVCAIACVANRGAGLASGPIAHDDVVDVVARAVAGAAGFLRAGIAYGAERWPRAQSR